MHNSMSESDRQRFLSRFTVAEPEECWEWTGSHDAYGYGVITIGGRSGRQMKAHRLAYAEAHGHLDASQHVLHSCDNAACVNPHHLRAGTQSENMRDMQDRGRRRGIVAARGERHGMSKLNEAAVREIKLSPEVGSKELAERFGVRPVTIRHIRAGRLWAWLSV